jgi:hypothetical protein
MARDGRRLLEHFSFGKCEQLGGFYRAEGGLKEKPLTRVEHIKHFIVFYSKMREKFKSYPACWPSTNSPTFDATGTASTAFMVLIHKPGHEIRPRSKTLASGTEQLEYSLLGPGRLN